MSTSLSAAEFAAANALSAMERYDHFVSLVTRLGEVWSLANGDDWVVMSCDGDECLPVWPHADFAKAFATDDWADCAPRAIPLQTWLTRWTPGMVRDGTLLAVFPGQSDEGIVASPEELAASLTQKSRRVV